MEADAATMQAMLQMANSSGMAGGTPGLADAGMPGMPPQFDPNMAQLYLQQMAQYFTQQTSATGLPPMPFPGLPNPYAPAMPAPEPAVSVSVDGMKFQYQLTEDDLMKVFSRYGSVKTIRVDEAGASAIITFMSFPDAQAAMNDLNGKVLNGLDGTLRINWLPPPNLPPAPYPGMPFPGWGLPPTAPAGQGWPGVPPADAAPAAAAARNMTSSATALEKSPPGNKSQRKYTCRFIIGIENDKDFQVARRIIGAKGANMKRIVRQTEAKLRLRGVGSGYFEGAGQKESSEPLQLCISCTSQDGYKVAVKNVEDLLHRVYEEYKQFCRESGKEIPNLEINFTENQLVYNSRTPFVGGTSLFPDDEDGPTSPGDDKKKGFKNRKAKTEDAANGTAASERGEPGPNAPTVEEIEKFIDERNEARRANNFPEADRIRQLLHARGVALMDEPGGRGRGTEVTTWRYWRD
mmetsp:Transcript_25403/g.46091  ORF Transcript_25403/g.46091 Transcript_25403/m.46091 type:complete len:463 (+) Transcript_25403:106-1494(+)